jgi:hypothetical protein
MFSCLVLKDVNCKTAHWKSLQISVKLKCKNYSFITNLKVEQRIWRRVSETWRSAYFSFIASHK